MLIFPLSRRRLGSLSVRVRRLGDGCSLILNDLERIFPDLDRRAPAKSADPSRVAMRTSSAPGLVALSDLVALSRLNCFQKSSILDRKPWSLSLISPQRKCRALPEGVWPSAEAVQRDGHAVCFPARREPATRRNKCATMDKVLTIVKSLWHFRKRACCSSI